MPKHNTPARQRKVNAQAPLVTGKRPPLVDEPYCPPLPPTQPAQWSAEEWQAWWVQLVRWCTYRAQFLGEEVAPLSPPPALDAPPADWRRWHTALKGWGFSRVHTAKPRWPSWPTSWQRDATVMRTCRICRQILSGAEIRTCPHCGNAVCRSCLYLSQDACPCCAGR